MNTITMKFECDKITTRDMVKMIVEEGNESYKNKHAVLEADYSKIPMQIIIKAENTLIGIMTFTTIAKCEQALLQHSVTNN